MERNNIRKAFKQLEQISNQMEQGLSMDLAMDGSGECGGMIHRSWNKWFRAQVEKVLAETNTTLEQLQEVATAWAERELEMGPKHITLSWGPKSSSFQKEKDIFDTKWGSLAFDLQQLNHA